jgi:hypothetical protein
MWKKEYKLTPDDLLHDLNFKIMYSIINNKGELYLIQLIKELRIRKDINQERLNLLDIKFRQRFSELHEIDEFSPENLDFEKSLHYLQSKKRFENDDLLLPDMN